MDEKKVIVAYQKRRQKRLDEIDDVPREDGGPGSGHWWHVGVPGIRGGSAPGGGSAFRIANGMKRVRAGTANRYTSRSQIINGYQKRDANGQLMWKKDAQGNYLLDANGRKIPEWNKGLKQMLNEAKKSGNEQMVRAIRDRLNTMTGSERGAERALDTKTAWNHDVIKRMVDEGKMKVGSAYYNHAMRMADSTASVKSLNTTASKDIINDKTGRGKEVTIKQPDMRGKTTREARDRVIRKGHRR